MNTKTRPWDRHTRLCPSCKKAEGVVGAFRAQDGKLVFSIDCPNIDCRRMRFGTTPEICWNNWNREDQ